MKITINENTIELKNTLRSILIYEQITGKVFQPITMTDIMIYFYSVVLASKPDINLTFNEFMDYLDNNQELFKDFSQWLMKENEKDNTISGVKKKMVNK